MDAARAGINQQIHLTPEMANEIKVSTVRNWLSIIWSILNVYYYTDAKFDNRVSKRKPK